MASPARHEATPSDRHAPPQAAHAALAEEAHEVLEAVTAVRRRPANEDKPWCYQSRYQSCGGARLFRARSLCSETSAPPPPANLRPPIHSVAPLPTHSHTRTRSQRCPSWLTGARAAAAGAGPGGDPERVRRAEGEAGTSSLHLTTIVLTKGSAHIQTARAAVLRSGGAAGLDGHANAIMRVRRPLPSAVAADQSSMMRCWLCVLC